jgi:hypothetical protein
MSFEDGISVSSRPESVLALSDHRSLPSMKQRRHNDESYSDDASYSMPITGRGEGHDSRSATLENTR